MEELGDRLRLARERRGLTQKRVMELTGINNKTLSGYENGVSEPDLRTLAVLLKLYRLSADQLLELSAAGAAAPTDEERLVSLYRQLPGEQRQELLLLLETLIRHRKQTEKV